jgi:hypothetical protein
MRRAGWVPAQKGSSEGAAAGLSSLASMQNATNPRAWTGFVAMRALSRRFVTNRVGARGFVALCT